MKVLHVAETIKGGVATVINELVNHQVKNYQVEEIKLLVPSSQISEITEKKNIITFNRSGRNPLSLLNLAKGFICLYFKFKPDVVHLHSTFAGLICRICLFFIPFSKVRIIYCPHAFSFLMTGSKVKKKIFSLIEMILQVKTDYIICVSEYEFNEAIKYHFNENKLKLIHNGVGIRVEAQSMTRSFSSEQVFTILFVGRFDYQKGYDLLCNTIEKFENINQDSIRFLLVGDFVNDKEFSEIKSSLLVNNLGWLPRHEVEKLYLKADLLVIPSRWEGFAMVPLEAFRSGLPVLASDYPSFKEIIRDGVTGYFFTNGCADSLYNKIESIRGLSNRDSVLNEISLNAINEYNFKFTSIIMNEKTMSLYLQ